MARNPIDKSPEAKPERAEAIKPMPFPGESPTVALAMAAAQMYGLHEEDEKPTKSQPKKRVAPKKKVAAPKKKAAAPKRKSTAQVRKPAKRTSASPSKGTRKG